MGSLDTDLTGITLEITGSADKVATVSVYRDGNGNGTFETPGDIQIGSSSPTGPMITVPVSISAINGAEQILFVVYDLASSAESGDVINVGVTGMTIDSQDGVAGLPAWSGTIQVVALVANTGGGGGGGRRGGGN